MQVIPAIDLEGGRSRVVFWPGASAGAGAPTDRPDRIAARFVEQGARLVHLVDFDGARAGRPVQSRGDRLGRRAVAVPLQVAGGVEDADADPARLRRRGDPRRPGHVRSSTTRTRLRRCLAVAGDWLAVGLDPRPDRLAAFPWKRSGRPDASTGSSASSSTAGVRRFVLAHGGATADLDLLARLVRAHDADFLVAGGATDPMAISRLRDAGVAGLILGEALLSGAIDFPAALEAAA